MKAIFALAENLDLGIIVEGIETDKQLAVVQRCGNSIIQGFFYSKPLNIEDFLEVLIRGGCEKCANSSAKVYNLIDLKKEGQLANGR